jgi:hypothetical protein
MVLCRFSGSVRACGGLCSTFVLHLLPEDAMTKALDRRIKGLMFCGGESGIF